MGLTERHWFEGENTPENQEWDLEDATYSKEQEKKTGEWIYKYGNLWYCSRCREIIYSETDDDLEIHHAYCSRCGAKMKQEVVKYE